MDRNRPSEGTRVNLYPDLKEFYNEGVVETGSSIDLPIDGLSRIVPTAPLPSEADHNSDHLRHHQHHHRLHHHQQHQHQPQHHNHQYHHHHHHSHSRHRHHSPDPDLAAPEEPELDYTLDIEPDYDLDDVDVEQLIPDNLNLDGPGNLNLNLNDPANLGLDDPANLNLNDLNLNAAEKKILHDKNIEVPRQPRDTKDFRAWMTWRLQANKLLAAVILIRKGHQVHLRKSEIRRKPLTQQNVRTIVREARGGSTDPLPRDGAERTSLIGCPYIMYGIPRVKLSTTSSGSSGKR